MKNWIFWILGLIVFEAAADYYSKVLSISQHWKVYFQALLFYVLCNACWLMAMKNGVGLVRGHTIFTVASTTIIYFLGFVFFKEELTVYQAWGLAFGWLGTILLMMEK